MSDDNTPHLLADARRGGAGKTYATTDGKGVVISSGHVGEQGKTGLDEMLRRVAAAASSSTGCPEGGRP